MARVTIEDCIKEIPNRFELCMIASERVKEMCAGALSVSLENENEKASVVALREIGLKRLNYDILKEKLIEHMRVRSNLDDASEVRSSTNDTSNEKAENLLDLDETFIFTGEEDGFNDEIEDIEDEFDK